MPEQLTRWITNLGIAATAVLVISSEFIRALPGDTLWDFGSFVASGRAAREGLNPYGIHPLTFHVTLPGFEAWNPNLNPPISALLFQLFDLTDPHRMLRIWWVVSALCYAATVFLLARRHTRPRVLFPVLAAFALAGFWDTLLLGQIYLPLVLAGTAAWLLLERGERAWAGVLIGLIVAMKPNFLVWPAILLLAGHRTAALAAIVMAAAVSAIPLIVFGPEVYRQWFELIASDRERAVFLTNASLGGLAARVGMPKLGIVLSLALLAGLALWALRQRPTAVRASGPALVAALLASPIAWVHYTLFLLPVLFARWNWLSIRVVTALLMVPVPFVIGQFGQPSWIQLTMGSVYGWALVLCFLVLLAAETSETLRRHSALQ